MNDSQLTGTGVVPGIAHAPAAWLRQLQLPPLDEGVVEEGERDAEKEKLLVAVATVADRYDARAATATGAANEVLTATAGLARDRGWTRAASKLVAAGSRAPKAVSEAIATFVAQFEQLGGVMAERTTDLKDIRDRVTAELLGLPEPGIPDPGEPFVLMAADLAPADTAGLDPERTVALVTELGGPTSHTTIIARQLGIPCVVAVAGLDDVPAGTEVLVDGATGRIVISPDSAEAAAEVERDRVERERVAGWSGPGATADGHPVEILANVQDGSGARAAHRTPAQGVGLFRTELCFLDRDTEPTEDEQADIYAEVFDAFEGRKVVLRTLDAGSDKPLRFANHPDEHNPALGVRGIRITTTAPGVLDRQLDAVAAAASRTGATPWVMAPMVATVSEAADFAARVRERGLSPGVMIEVPSAALLADRLLEHLDFLSIGTNDLAQYTMAADRMSPQLAALTDPWQPAVLALVARAAQAGAAASKPVGVCGEAAADPLLACVLAGMGVTSLSCAASAVTGVGARLASVPMDRCREAAEAVLASDDPVAARAAAAKLLD